MRPGQPRTMPPGWRRALLVGPLRSRRASCNLRPVQFRAKPVGPPSRVRLESLMKKLPRLIACFLVLSGSVPAVAAQSTGGSLSGTVKDATGAVLPGVTVLVTRTDTSSTRAVITDGAGRYVAP